VSGARVTGPLGPPTTDGSYVKDAAEARAYVRTLKAAGVDHVKVELTLTDEQLRAVIEECRAQGLPVATIGSAEELIAGGRNGFPGNHSDWRVSDYRLTWQRRNGYRDRTPDPAESRQGCERRD
jgi:hypothetical protein